jgi:hypothetical protein
VTWGAFFYPHQVKVRDYLGMGGMGPSYGASRALAAEVKDEQKLIRSKDGAEVVSSSNVTVDVAAEVPLGSLVTVWAGTAAQRESAVLAVSRNENGDTPLDSFLLLYLT